MVKIMRLESTLARVVLIASLLSLSACNWVDSAGAQDSDSSADPIDDVTLIDPSIRALEENVVSTMLENTANRVRLVGSDSQPAALIWSLESDNNPNLCASSVDFDVQLAAESLASACSDTSNCQTQIDVAESDNEADFIVTLPRLQAPVALRYRLSTTLDDGTDVNREQIICALSVNEAPTVVDDNYRALPGVRRTVRSDDLDSLLSNDTDDQDVRNAELSVVTELVSAPTYASRFTLDANGSFAYTASDSLPLSDNQTLIDSFVYKVTDGLHEVEATATIRVVSSNAAPQTIGSLPDVSLTRNTENETFEETIDASSYFRDSNGDALHFYVSTEQLPDSVKIVATESGLLQISTLNIADEAPPTGSWFIEVTASDGLSMVSSDFTLSIENTPELDNTPPVAEQIPDLIARNRFRYDASGFFSDSDDDELIFSAQGLPTGALFSTTGVLTGISDASNAGSYTVIFTATDPFGVTASSEFTLLMN